MTRTAKAELTVAEAAALTGKSAATIYRWMRGGQLASEETAAGPVVKTADVWRVAAAVKPGRPRKVAGLQ